LNKKYPWKNIVLSQKWTTIACINSKVQQNSGVILKELDSLAKEMRALRLKAKLTYLYHHWMEEFDNLKMEYDFMKIELLIYQKRSKKSQAKQWGLYKEQINEIILEAFESYKKNKELYQLCLETY
jgi:L-2-hydroxyglutarate oxidase LhgO